jgi:drug/metabolite transporter (DMT)-like permease
MLCAQCATRRAVPTGELFALTAAASWAVGSLLFARIGRRVAPGAMNLGKCVTAAVLLSLTRLVLTPSLGPVPWSRDAAIPLALSGIVGLTIGDTAYFGAIVTLGVPRAILLLSAAPVFATLGGMVFLGEPIGGREAFGIGLTLAGIGLVVSGRAAVPAALAEAGAGKAGAADEARARIRRGILLGIVAALGQASGSLLSRKAMRLGVDPLAAAAGRLVVGAGAMVIASSLTGHVRPWVADLRTDFGWAKVAAASLVGTYGGIWLAQLALAHTSSTGVATTLLATSPIFALPLAHFVGHERITARGALGTVVAIGGVVLLTLRGR